MDAARSSNQVRTWILNHRNEQKTKTGQSKWVAKYRHNVKDRAASLQVELQRRASNPDLDSAAGRELLERCTKMESLPMVAVSVGMETQHLGTDKFLVPPVHLEDVTPTAAWVFEHNDVCEITGELINS